jgi:hypothetical protein
MAGNLSLKSYGPYWGSGISIVGGRDHLGMQRAAFSTYSVMLPGLSNLTKRLGYYPLYCFLLECYAKEIGSTDEKKLKRFIRRSEFVYSACCLLNNHDEGGIMGSVFIKRIFKKNDYKTENIQFELSEYADRDGNKKTYWKHSGGAFYQYYLGPMTELGLVTKNEQGLPIATDRGKALSDLYSKNFGDQYIAQYLDIVDRGGCSTEELRSLASVIKPIISIGESNEYSVMLDYLFNVDSISSQNVYYRKDTLLDLLTFLSINKLNDKVPTLFSENKFKEWFSETYDSKKDIVNAWGYYYLNEMGHFLAESILSIVILRIRNEAKAGYISIDELVSYIYEDCLGELNNSKKYNFLEGIKTIEGFLSRLKSESMSNEEYLLKEFNSIYSRQDRSILDCIVAILILTSILHMRTENIRKILFDMGVRIDQNETLSMIDSVYRMKAMSFRDFMSNFLLNQIIFKHIKNALRKTNDFGKTTLKFLYENNELKDAGEEAPPRLTSPRLNSALNFLVDLELLDQDFNITSKGEEVLKQYG